MHCLVNRWVRRHWKTFKHTSTSATAQHVFFRCAQEFFEQEAQLALQDRIQRETADSKNALESYVYSLRSKLSDQLSSYAPAATRDALIERLNDMEVRKIVSQQSCSASVGCCGRLDTVGKDVRRRPADTCAAHIGGRARAAQVWLRRWLCCDSWHVARDALDPSCRVQAC